jgi:hypothetical protein
MKCLLTSFLSSTAMNMFAYVGAMGDPKAVPWICKMCVCCQLSICSNVICATQIMSVALADTYISALMNTSHLLSEPCGWTARGDRLWENAKKLCNCKKYKNAKKLFFDNVSNVKLTSYKKERQMAISNHVPSHFIIVNNKLSFKFSCLYRESSFL